MINLKLTKSDKKKIVDKYSIGPDNNDYPYGTCLRLEKEIIDKSDKLKNLEGGKTIEMKVIAFVKEIEYKDTGKGKEPVCIEIQMQKIDIM